MKQFAFVFYLFFTFLLNSKAQTDSTSMAQKLMLIEEKLNDNLPGDSSLWAKYLDPKWYIVDEDGNGITRNEFLQGFAPFPKEVSGYIKIINPVFTFHDNIVVVHYVADEHENFYGNHLHTTYGTMDTWYKTDTSWMMLGMVSFEIPALPPSIKVDSQTLKLYTGIYKLSDSNTAVVTLKDDTLFLQKKKRPQLLFCRNTEYFFRKGDARGRKFFVKDDHGQMLMLERRNGRDVIWRRIK